jgi:3'(2'), 5'-bisphosphate nucleotidase
MDRLMDIAALAGSRIMQIYGGSCAVDRKDDGSPLTAADRAAHECIQRELMQWTPDVPVISEEGDLTPFDERQRWTRFWLVDPLDGTKEFLARNGEFTVNVALIDNGEPVLGVVAAPALDTTYVAGRELGAWRRVGAGTTTRIVGRSPSPHVTRIVESRSHSSADLEGFIAMLGPVERIKVGSSLKFCRIAEGSADMYPRFGRTMEWDVAAGDCVFRNSGPDGEPRESPLVYNQPDLSTPRFVIGSPAKSPPRAV